MKKMKLACLAASLLLCAPSFAIKIYDGEVVQRIIKQSISSFPGNCACPYNKEKDGSTCGQRSIYSRVSDFEIICYPQDVTLDMIRTYRASH
jgi:hypothetical protein